MANFQIAKFDGLLKSHLVNNWKQKLECAPISKYVKMIWSSPFTIISGQNWIYNFRALAISTRRWWIVALVYFRWLLSLFYYARYCCILRWKRKNLVFCYHLAMLNILPGNYTILDASLIYSRVEIYEYMNPADIFFYCINVNFPGGETPRKTNINFFQAIFFSRVILKNNSKKRKQF